MTVSALEGRVVSTPSQNTYKVPRTEYVYVQDKGSGQQQGGGQRSVTYTPQRTKVPKGVPGFLGSKALIFGCWGVSIALVSWDEWTVNGILPRPLRLWDTTWVFGGLALLSTFDALVPIANALAIGYTLVLLYQFFSGKGSFGAEGAAIAEAGA